MILNRRDIVLVAEQIRTRRKTMGNRFLFRGKVKDEPDEWVIGDLFTQPNGSYDIHQEKRHEKSKHCDYGIFGVHKESIGQCTGLEDKNGKLIYEGDIVDFYIFDHNGIDHWYKGVIKYNDFMWQIWKNPNFEYYGTDGAFCLCQIEECECIQIIGNIHDNPELLGEKKED